MLLGSLASALGLVGGRAVPVVASVVLHASLAVGLVASAAGHSRAGASAPAATIELAVDIETEAPVLVPEPPPAPASTADKAAAAPTHTHPYPVDPSHDARPHDPSEHHDEAAAAHHQETPAHHDHEPAAAAPALVADGAVLPRFTLATGSGTPATGTYVAAGGLGTGTSASPAGHSHDGHDGAGDDVIIAASAVQVPARLAHSVTAAYPAHARADDVEGDVAVEIVVDREGRVIDARVLRPAGHGFDEAALSAVRAYRFSPAQREGHAVRVRMPWSVQFRLR